MENIDEKKNEGPHVQLSYLKHTGVFKYFVEKNSNPIVTKNYRIIKKFHKLG